MDCETCNFNLQKFRHGRLIKSENQLIMTKDATKSTTEKIFFFATVFEIKLNSEEDSEKEEEQPNRKISVIVDVELF